MQCSMLITLIKLIIENLIDFTFDNCLSKGGEGNNVANDLEEENFVQFDKKTTEANGCAENFKGCRTVNFC